ncbi:MAG: sigma-54-dependent Fis family transcriptional regulator, partial [Burkholderiales bacterium]|nr:sigma-54-dependent Fis family transcriptional regulator [Burkholderiales bacterium]
MPHVLIVDDDRNTAEALVDLTAEQGFTASIASSLREARIQMIRRQPDVVLIDLKLPDGDGMSLFGDLERNVTRAVVVITGHASVESAVEALRIGATDYLVKPINIARLQAILSRVPRAADLEATVRQLREDLAQTGRFGRMIGASPVMRSLYEQVIRVAPTEATVLLVGESGTGKELVAHTLHDLSRRHAAPFLAVNCGAISPNLIESEMFGHERGSFTGAERQHKGYFERANGGTLFLDEITEMPVELQVKLLRVLETGSFMRVGTNRELEIDVRVVAATNRNPEAAVADGKLRADLYHRLNVFPLHLPPLRERGDDAELLARHFLGELNAEHGAAKVLPEATLARIRQHGWAGNVRELRNYMQRTFILSDRELEPLQPGLDVAVSSSESIDMINIPVVTSFAEA